MISKFSYQIFYFYFKHYKSYVPRNIFKVIIIINEYGLGNLFNIER